MNLGNGRATSWLPSFHFLSASGKKTSVPCSPLLLAPTVPRRVKGMCEPRFFAGSYPAPRAKDVLCHRCADDGAECSGTSEGGVSVSSHAQCRSKVDRQLGSVSRSLRPRPQICC